MAKRAYVRKGTPSPQLAKQEFAKRFRSRFYDPVFSEAYRRKLFLEYKPYATTHDELDKERDFHGEVRNTARSLVHLAAGRTQFTRRSGSRSTTKMTSPFRLFLFGFPAGNFSTFAASLGQSDCNGLLAAGYFFS